MEHLTAASLFERGRAALEGKAPQTRPPALLQRTQSLRPRGRPAIPRGHPRGDWPEWRGILTTTNRPRVTTAPRPNSIETSDDRINLAHAARHVADILREIGRVAAAGPFIQEAIDIYRAQKPLPQLHLANALRVAALLQEQAGCDAEALPLWMEANALYRAVGVDAGVAESRAHLAAR